MKLSRPKRTRLRGQSVRAAPSLSPTALSAVNELTFHRFADQALIQRALVHPSAADPKKPNASYQRLEFLGDRVLGLVIAEALFERFADVREGGLARRLNALVNRDSCAKVARKSGLSAHVMVGRAERANGTAEQDSVHADLCESVIAALYLDGGLKVARRFILHYWAEMLGGVGRSEIDPKTRLQHRALEKGLGLPDYEMLSRSGPDHSPEFYVRVCIGPGPSSTGYGTSRQKAEQSAAAAYLRDHFLEQDPSV